MTDTNREAALALADKLTKGFAGMGARDPEKYSAGVTVAKALEAAALIRALVDQMDAAIIKHDLTDGMEGGATSAIRDMLNLHNVPIAAFIDDHVGNAIAQRDTAWMEISALRERVKVLEYAENAAHLYIDASDGELRDWGITRSILLDRYRLARAALEPNP